MNDRFKFRVWGMDECHYVDEPLIDAVRGVAMRYDGFADGNLEIDNVIIEQCTGLKDRNGKLIYEGDIVRKMEHDWLVSDEYMVPSEGYAPEAIQSEMEWNCGCCDLIYGWKMPFLIEEDTCHVEIIGNIHENPELLENDS